MTDTEEAPIDTFEGDVVEEEAAEEEEYADADIIGTPTTEAKLFGKWEFSDIEVGDVSLSVSFVFMFRC